jgi:hypothetical protein
LATGAALPQPSDTAIPNASTRKRLLMATSARG